jgi:predicted amidohydrolase
MSRAISVGAVHAAPFLLDRTATIARACDWIAEAGRQGVNLLVFPEVFVPGFPYWINLYPPAEQHAIQARYIEASVDVDAGDLEAVCRAAAAAQVVVVLGVSERLGSTIYNSQAFIGADGTLLGIHRKIQLTYAERFLWGQGDGATLGGLDTQIGRIGGLICYEHMMNLARQALIDDGVQIHCASWPTFASTRGRGEAYDRLVDTLMRAHAITGQCFVVMAQPPVTAEMISTFESQLGSQQSLSPGGGMSAIYSPQGEVIAEHRGPSERLIVADIDLAAILKAKVLVDGAGHYARPEILSLRRDRTAWRLPYSAK